MMMHHKVNIIIDIIFKIYSIIKKESIIIYLTINESGYCFDHLALEDPSLHGI